MFDFLIHLGGFFFIMRFCRHRIITHFFSKKSCKYFRIAVCGNYFFTSCCFYGTQKSVPIGVVTENESAGHSLSSSCSAESHPPTSRARRKWNTTAKPRGGVRPRRRDATV